MSTCDHCGKDYPLEDCMFLMIGLRALRLCSWGCVKDLAATRVLEQEEENV